MSFRKIIIFIIALCYPLATFSINDGDFIEKYGKKGEKIVKVVNVYIEKLTESEINLLQERLRSAPRSTSFSLDLISLISQKISDSTLVLKKNCNFDNTIFPHGRKTKFYKTSIVEFPNECKSQDRICVDGKLFGSYKYNTCSVTEKKCKLNGQEVAHGYGQVFYSKNKSRSCATKKTIRICDNGTFDGDRDFKYIQCDPIKETDEKSPGQENANEYFFTENFEGTGINSYLLLDSAERHFAFPALTLSDKGDILLLYRNGETHVSAGKVDIFTYKKGDPKGDVDTFFNGSYESKVNTGLYTLKSGRIVAPVVETIIGQSSNTYIRYSDDDGKTWSNKSLVNRGPGYKTSFAYGRIAELNSGELLLSIYSHGSAHLHISRDDGENWEYYSTPFPEPLDKIYTSEQFSESSYVQKQDRIYGVSRYHPSGKHFEHAIMITYSDDDGITWQTPRLLFDGVSPEIIKLQSGKLLLCLGDRKGEYRGVRCHIEKGISNDGFPIFGEGYMIYSHDFDDANTGYNDEKSAWDYGYPSIVEIEKNKILVAYYGGNQDIFLAHFDVGILD